MLNYTKRQFYFLFCMYVEPDFFVLPEEYRLVVLRTGCLGQYLDLREVK